MFVILAISDSVSLRQLAIVIKFVIHAIFAISSIHFCKPFPLNFFFAKIAKKFATTFLRQSTHKRQRVSRRQDCWGGAKRCEQKKTARGWGGVVGTGVGWGGEGGGEGGGDGGGVG